MTVQFDPHLHQLLLEESERPPGVRGGRRVGVIARVADPGVEIPDLEVVVRAGTIVSGRVDVASLVSVRQHPNVLSLKRTHQYLPHDVLVQERGAAAAAAPRAHLPWSGSGVVIGILDWGFDFAHADFVSPADRSQHGEVGTGDAVKTTRFVSIWDQRGGATPLSPAPYGYGRELDAAAINRALASPDPYAELGYDPAEVDPLGHGTHGTHALGIACGNGRATASTPSPAHNASIVAVHLRGDDTYPEDTLADSVRILEAVDYVFAKAGDRPVVVNMSLGRCGGPHDRSPLVVQALDAMLEEVAGRQIVCSVGNYFGTGQHRSGQLVDGVAVEWGWVVERPIVDNAELEIWYSSDDDLTVELVDPGGTVVLRLAPGDERVMRGGGQVIASAFHRQGDPGNHDNVVDLFLWPVARGGLWRVRLLPGRIENGEVHGWIERVYRGHQSRFEEPDPLFTTNTICNGRRTLAVAAYDGRATEPQPGPFSSAGPTRDLHRKPDLAAPGVGIPAARSSVVVNGRRERDGVTTMTGTSMAAPHVTAAIALLFEAAGRPLRSDEVTALLCDTARASPIGPERVGHGLLDIDAALRRLAQ